MREPTAAAAVAAAAPVACASPVEPVWSESHRRYFAALRAAHARGLFRKVGREISPLFWTLPCAGATLGQCARAAFGDCSKAHAWEEVMWFRAHKLCFRGAKCHAEEGGCWYSHGGRMPTERLEEMEDCGRGEGGGRRDRRKRSRFDVAPREKTGNQSNGANNGATHDSLSGRLR